MSVLLAAHSTASTDHGRERSETDDMHDIWLDSRDIFWAIDFRSIALRTSTVAKDACPMSEIAWSL